MCALMLHIICYMNNIAILKMNIVSTPSVWVSFCRNTYFEIYFMVFVKKCIIWKKNNLDRFDGVVLQLIKKIEGLRDNDNQKCIA